MAEKKYAFTNVELCLPNNFPSPDIAEEKISVLAKGKRKRIFPCMLDEQLYIEV